MNDSFSQLAKKIRQNKINKKEIQKIKREIIDDKVLKIIKNDMAIKIQKIIRGFLYRKKFYIILDEINKETIINYLYEKKLNRIKIEYKKIISFHLSNYIKSIREKEKLNKHKIHCIDLIKAVLRGIIFRNKFNKEISSFREFKDKIERYILGYKIKLILRSNNIQSLLIDIANIKYSLNNIDKTNDANNQKIKEYKTKLTKNINLFYFTFYQMKENSNWISQTKIKDPWIKKYMSIINKDIDNDKNNLFIKKKSIYSNQKKIKRLKENNNNKNSDKKEIFKNSEFKFNNTINYEKEINNEKELLNDDNNSNSNLKENKENKDNNSSSINNSDNNNSSKNEKNNYNFNFYDSENEESNENVNRKLLHKGTDIYTNYNSKNEIKIKKNKTIKDDTEINQEKNITEEKDKKVRSNIVKRYKAKKLENEQKLSSNQSQSKSYENKEDNNKSEKEENEIHKEETQENNKENSKENIIENSKDNSKENEKDLEKENENKPKKLNKYQQREERPIKPLTNVNFLENENPFGLKRESSDNISENQNLNLEPPGKKNTIEKRIISSTRAINRAIITYNKKGKNKKQNISEIEKEETTIKTQEKTDLSHEDIPVSNKYIEYDNRPCGGAKYSEFYNPSKYDESQSMEKIDRNEKPLTGANKIDYNAMFGEGGMEFEGDPFGGAKQYESNNKDKVKNVNIHKTNNVKKKPVYDARKAIEEAKLKEAKEGKKEKPSAFREFLREMKKISAEEKAQHNETNADNLKQEKKIKNKNNKNEIKENILELKTENNINIEKNKLDKLDTEEKSIKKNTVKKPDKKLNLNTENEDYSKNDNNPLNLDEKDNTLKKKHRGSLANKGTETKEIALRRKLHELEKAPAPVLNIKGIKSRIECWSGNNDNKRSKINSIATKTKDAPKSKDEKKTKDNKNNDQKIISNFNNNKKTKETTLSEGNNSGNNKINSKNLSTNDIPRISKNLEEKIEKYVDKKLMQLNLQIEEIDELFNFENYFKEKEEKMKNFINLPYIKQNYDYVAKYSNEDYDEKMNQIEKIYKELK